MTVQWHCLVCFCFIENLLCALIKEYQFFRYINAKYTNIYKHTSHITTHYDIPLIQFVFKVTQKDLKSSLMMAGYC
jgi:hypothetical protein